jgi:hypothetical protein
VEILSWGGSPLFLITWGVKITSWTKIIIMGGPPTKIRSRGRLSEIWMVRPKIWSRGAFPKSLIFTVVYKATAVRIIVKKIFLTKISTGGPSWGSIMCMEIA